MIMCRPLGDASIDWIPGQARNDEGGQPGVTNGGQVQKRVGTDLSPSPAVPGALKLFDDDGQALTPRVAGAVDPVFRLVP